MIRMLTKEQLNIMDDWMQAEARPSCEVELPV